MTGRLPKYSPSRTSRPLSSVNGRSSGICWSDPLIDADLARAARAWPPPDPPARRRQPLRATRRDAQRSASATSCRRPGDETHDSAFRSSDRSALPPPRRRAGVRRFCSAGVACGVRAARPLPPLESCGRPIDSPNAGACVPSAGSPRRRRGPAGHARRAASSPGRSGRGRRRPSDRPSRSRAELVFGLPQRPQDSRLVGHELRLPARCRRTATPSRRGICVAGTASGDSFGSRAAAWLSSTSNRPQTISRA